MANSASTANLQKKLWRKELFKDIMDENYFAQSGLMGEGENNIVQVLNDLKKEAGDTITIPLTAKLSGKGVAGDAELEGNEESINPYSESISIDQMRNAVRLKGRYDEKRNVYDMYMDAKDKLKIWGSEFIERQIFLKMAGVSVASLTDVNGVEQIGTSIDGTVLSTWSNTPDGQTSAVEAAGTGERYLCADAAGIDSLAATDVLTVSVIRQAKMKAKLANPKVKPLRIKGKDYYVMFIHPHQALDLKASTDYDTAMENAAVRGDDNPIFTGALAVIDGVILVEHEYVPSLDGDNASIVFTSGNTTYVPDGVRCFRSMLCGQQAIVMAQTENSWEMNEKTFDYNNKNGVATSFIGGIQKVRFNSKDYGVVTVDTSATAYTAVA
jgi:N4-gp56 family major capsid protein